MAFLIFDRVFICILVFVEFSPKIDYIQGKKNIVENALS